MILILKAILNFLIYIKIREDDMKPIKLRLCFRCEHRARYQETGDAVRHECGNINDGVCSCYSFRPMSPVILEKSNPHDTKIRFGPSFIAPREKIVGISNDFSLNVKWLDKGRAVLYLEDSDEHL